MVIKKSVMVKAQYIFYIIGIIFLFSTLAYFAYEYLFSLSNGAKTIILVCLTVISFFVADYLSERDL
ncbi:MAG: hypothetical protein MAG795_00645 [Candidatus Woesearchaeota archaeon]|nr:hypothetical protein [Candidatus Woesearchaeota archaeon]